MHDHECYNYMYIHKMPVSVYFTWTFTYTSSVASEKAGEELSKNELVHAWNVLIN